MLEFYRKRGPSVFIVLAIPTLFISQYLSLKFNQKVKDDFFWVSHTFEVNDQLRGIASDLLDIQNGLKGYVITLQPSQKQAIDRAFQGAEKYRTKASILTQDNPDQQKRLGILKNLLIQRRIDADFLIKLRDEKGFLAAKQMIFLGTGSGVTASILSKIKAMEDEENQLLKRRETQAQISANSSSNTVIFGIIFSTLLLFFAAIFVRRDLLTRALANEELSLSEAKFRHTFAYSPIGVGMLSLDGIWEEVNETFCKMLGYSESELVGHHFNEITHPDDIKIGTTQSEKLKNGELEIAVYEKRYFKKSGQELITLVHLTVLRDGKGKQLRYLGEFLDISERKRVEEALRTEKEFNESITALVPNSIYVYDLPSQTFIYSNHEFGAYLGYDRTEVELLGSSFMKNILHPDDFELLSDSFFSGQINQVENTLRIKHASGEWTWVLSRLAVFKRDDAGKPLQMIGVYQDISELKNKEELLAQAVKTKAEFLANMSHEIRTPLNGIIATTDILMEGVLNAEQTRYTRIVQASGLSLLTIINDILDFSKIEAGKFIMDSTQFSLAFVIEGQMELLLGKAKEKELTLASFIDPKLPLKILGDSGRVGQVLLNLIGNAIKFTDKGGVSIRAFEDGPSRSAGKIRIRVEVEDSGIGITDAVAQKLFQPFTQADGSTSRKYGGTGLGLSISKKLVEYMGGEIGVSSSQNSGSVFWFTAELELPKPAMYLGEPKLLANLKILICDQDSLIVNALESYLNAWRMRNEKVSQSSDAILRIEEAQSQNDPFRILLISEEQMNLQRDRIQALTRSQTHSLKIIIIDASFREHPGQFSLLKPIKQSTLLDTMMSALGQKTVFESMEDSRNREQVKTLTAEERLANKRFKILIAEDNSVNQIIALKILDTLGYTAQAVANGKEAVEALHQNNYDLVLMDCQMPEMDGYEASMQVRRSADATVKSIPIIALTANAMKGDEEKCIKAGMSDYLAKPIRKEKLAEKLLQWLNHTS